MKEYFEIARIFVDHLNKEESIGGDYKYEFSERPFEFTEFWYFDFKIVSKTTSKNESSKFGGAPGFSINKKTKEAEIIAWWEKSELEEQKKKRKRLYEILGEIIREDWNAVAIKKLLGYCHEMHYA